MYSDLLPILRCPRCPSQSLTAPREIQTGDDGELVEVLLACRSGKHRYRIHDGVLDLSGWCPPRSPAQLRNYLPPSVWAYERVWRPYALTMFSGQRFGYERELALVTALAAPGREGLYVDLSC